MILLYQVIGVFDLPSFYTLGKRPGGLEISNRPGIGSAPVSTLDLEVTGGYQVRERACLLRPVYKQIKSRAAMIM
jgi:hypothetical protein